MTNLTSEQIDRCVLRAGDVLRSVLAVGEHKYYALPLLFLRLLHPYIQTQLGMSRPTHPNLLMAGAPLDRLLREIEGLFFPERKSQELAAAISATLKLVERCFPLQLLGVFRSTDFSSELLGDARQRNMIIDELVDCFAGLNFDAGASSIDGMSFGEAFDSAISHLAAQSKEGGEYATPPAVSKLVANLVGHGSARSYYDPTCGSGSLLSMCAHEAQTHGSMPSVVGQEKNGAAWSLAKMNLFLAGVDSANIYLEDCLLFPPLAEDGSLRQFDTVVAHPPWALKNWGMEFVKYDRFRRFDLGLPAKFSSDYAFILHMLSAVNPSCGQLAVIVPNGTLFKSGNESAIRQKLIELNLVDAVIGLPPKLFFNTSIPANILILKFERGTRDVFIVDAGSGYTPLKNRNEFSESGINRVTAAYRQREEIAGFSRRVDLEEVKANGCDLSVTRYIWTEKKEERVDLEAVRQRRRQVERELNEVEAQLEDAILHAALLTK
jgi:type I restriction enzyme M protein